MTGPTGSDSQWLISSLGDSGGGLVAPGTSSCASIGQAGVFTLSPPGIDPFTARCDSDGFMKILQINSAYTPTRAGLV